MIGCAVPNIETANSGILRRDIEQPVERPHNSQSDEYNVV